MNRWGALAILLAFVGALAFRLPRLDVRPLHNDEAVNAFKVADLWEQDRYTYDPDEYHGPTLHYFSLPFLWAGPDRSSAQLSDRTLRLAPVFFGAALVLLLPLFAGGLSNTALSVAALLIAISPAMVFYSRYFIHEMLLVFFTALGLGAGWRYAQRPSAFWAAPAGAAAALMFATKETFVLTIAAAILGLFLPDMRSAMARMAKLFRARNLRLHVCVGLLAFGVVWMLFFSSFFTNWKGLPDSIRTYLPWLKRASGESVHIHPWYFYLQRLAWFHPLKGPGWSEALILLLGLAGAVRAFSGGAPFARFLTIFTLVLTAIYSAISYKTPWCLLSFLFGMILLAGFGADALLRQIRKPSLRLSLGIILLLGVAQLGWQSWRASFVYASDRRNPYVYAQAVPDIRKLAQRIEAVANIGPDGRDTVVKLIAPKSDYWPLPWYLRRLSNTGWYESLPEDPYAPMVVVSANLDAKLDEKSQRRWIMAGITELRPGKFLELYVEIELWKKFIATLPPDPE